MGDKRDNKQNKKAEPRTANDQLGENTYAKGVDNKESRESSNKKDRK